MISFRKQRTSNLLKSVLKLIQSIYRPQKESQNFFKLSFSTVDLISFDFDLILFDFLSNDTCILKLGISIKFSTSYNPRSAKTWIRSTVPSLIVLLVIASFIGPQKLINP